MASLVSDNGGWCEVASRSNGGNHLFDSKLAEWLSHFFLNKKVASFGDGPGDFKKYIDDTKRVKEYVAYDGAPYASNTSEGRVKFLDLSAPQYGLPLYDWIISLEVAEHIPRQFESIYIDNIVRHANEGVVISWAPPGQVGLSHVNNQPFSYVKDILSKHGFTHNVEVSKDLQNSATFHWLKSNSNIFERSTDSPLYLEDI